ncbi:hypothetical protein DEA98_29395 (plasmid) [Brucella pseudogrignonensis]|nr:hypothetical protein [Brucella pseudogrignonensis]
MAQLTETANWIFMRIQRGQIFSIANTFQITQSVSADRDHYRRCREIVLPILKRFLEFSGWNIKQPAFCQFANLA